ncbi:helix-turn-helix domain-containing protein [Bifidobacterium cuniculi]|uniref:helix-turn-helix domain-containing protein n=1 Tax=Bifidobacterium cuniculi TaxID=1688 RepID=UPI000529F204|nr:hypothetical protein [Bifidobacterium cuniculi]
MTPAEFKSCRESLGLSTRWLADRWGVSEYSVQRWERSRLLPDDLQADLLGLQVRFAAEVAKGIEEHGDAIIVPRTNAESVQDFPATWWRLIAWQIRLKTGGVILYYDDDTDGLDDEVDDLEGDDEQA